MPAPTSQSPSSKPILYAFLAVALATLVVGVVAMFRAAKEKTSDRKAPPVPEQQNRE